MAAGNCTVPSLCCVFRWGSKFEIQGVCRAVRCRQCCSDRHICSEWQRRRYLQRCVADGANKQFPTASFGLATGTESRAGCSRTVNLSLVPLLECASSSARTTHVNLHKECSTETDWQLRLKGILYSCFEDDIRRGAWASKGQSRLRESRSAESAALAQYEVMGPKRRSVASLLSCPCTLPCRRYVHRVMW